MLAACSERGRSAGSWQRRGVVVLWSSWVRAIDVQMELDDEVGRRR
jgi:hypothetical protein